MIRRALVLPFFTCAVSLVASSARADRSIDVVMTPPAMDAYGLQVVDRAQTPQQFEFGMSANVGWAGKPLRLTLNDTNMGRQEALFAVIENQVTLDVGFYFGLWDFLSLSAMVPVGVNYYDANAVGDPTVSVLPTPPATTGSTVSTGIYAGQPRQNVVLSTVGVRDPRFAVKARFYGGKYFEIGTLLEVTAPLGDSSSFLGDKNFTFRPKLLLGGLFGRLHVLGSFGAVVRQSSQLFEPNPTTAQASDPPLRLTVGHELTWGGALTVRLHRVIGLGIEAVGTIPVTGDKTNMTGTALGSIYILPTEKLRLTLTGGGGLLGSDPRNPTGRVMVGMAYSMLPRAGGLL
ncbi:MAG TPA: hypothetical protein PKO07_22890 [Pseudomonadota bacterium]|nr:hypothetical protein [Pseudomonadota bacterium]HNN53896.1 hypothetical protein [Pseudomonadota bacterium]